MKRSAVYVCLGAWILALVVQLIVMLRLPDQVSAFGVDITRASHALLVRQLLFAVLGLALACLAFINARVRWPLLVVSSLLYLLHWFPWRLVENLGLLASAKAIYQSAAAPLSFVRDLVLPVVFVAVIAMVAMPPRKASV